MGTDFRSMPTRFGIRSYCWHWMVLTRRQKFPWLGSVASRSECFSKCYFASASLLRSRVDAQLLPFIFVSLSAFLLVLGHLHIRIFQRRIKESLTPGTTPASSNLTILRAHIRQYGGKRVYGLIFMRALGLALLAVMSANGRTKQCFRLEAICSTSVAMVSLVKLSFWT